MTRVYQEWKRSIGHAQLCDSATCLACSIGVIDRYVRMFQNRLLAASINKHFQLHRREPVKG